MWKSFLASSFIILQTGRGTPLASLQIRNEEFPAVNVGWLSDYSERRFRGVLQLPYRNSMMS
jgi:hypothetical protein